MRGSGIILGAAIAAFLLPGCGGTDDDGAGVRFGRIAGIHTVQGESHTLYVEIETDGWCVEGERAPELETIDLERSSGTEVVLTATVRYFREATGVVCRGVGYPVFETLRIERPVRHLAIYDGSESPPRRLGLPQMSRREFRQALGGHYRDLFGRRDGSE